MRMCKPRTIADHLLDSQFLFQVRAHLHLRQMSGSCVNGQVDKDADEC